ncbi:MAG TPA: type 4a pilus biogenesis protein PilO [Opitutaceae bacterium]|nr:type 4a pilus biogenesis protein PilO [Opitutaceae bacterium]
MSKDQSPKAFALRYPLALASAGVALLLAGVTAFRFSSLDEATTELESLRSDAQKAERNVRNASGIEQHLEVLTKNVGRLESMLIGVDDVSGNQAFFYRLETNTGVRIVVLRPGGAAKDAAKTASYVPAGFNVVVQGSYAQIVAFLGALEDRERLYRLNDFTIQRASDQQAGGGPEVALNLNLQLLAKKS